MRAAETTEGCERLGIIPYLTLADSPQQNGKQEHFWTLIEGRLMPMLEGQKVLLEPALMQLRFGDEAVRPRFDLETVGGDTIIVKASFERGSDKRRHAKPEEPCARLGRCVQPRREHRTR